MSITQKRQSCDNMHATLKARAKWSSPLDISSASTEYLGVQLSAFNLKWRGVTVECWYQGSKVYKNAGVMHKLYHADSKAAKHSMKELSDDTVVGFNLEGVKYPMKPATVFYDYIYLQGLLETYGNDLDLSMYNVFTDVQATLDIDACQARTVCEYTLLQKNKQLPLLDDFEKFKTWHEVFVKG